MLYMTKTFSKYVRKTAFETVMSFMSACLITQTYRLNRCTEWVELCNSPGAFSCWLVNGIFLYLNT